MPTGSPRRKPEGIARVEASAKSSPVLSWTPAAVSKTHTSASAASPLRRPDQTLRSCISGVLQKRPGQRHELMYQQSLTTKLSDRWKDGLMQALQPTTRTHMWRSKTLKVEKTANHSSTALHMLTSISVRGHAGWLESRSLAVKFHRHVLLHKGNIVDGGPKAPRMCPDKCVAHARHRPHRAAKKKNNRSGDRAL